MNNQKDIQRTDLNIYDKSNVPDNKSLFGLPVCNIINKRTEKLVTALYLVSDCMDDKDPVKAKLRLLGIKLLSDTYRLSISFPSNKYEEIVTSLNRINEIISLLEISYNIGLISEMNASILKSEFRTLTVSIESDMAQDKNFAFSLDRRMFDLQLTQMENGSNHMSDRSPLERKSIKDRSLNGFGISPLDNFGNVKRTSHPSSTIIDKQDRKDKILSLIKDKKEVTIKDISLAIKDCSEKTIQRELNTLVSKGQIKKTGSKRWSRYFIIEAGNNK